MPIASKRKHGECRSSVSGAHSSIAYVAEGRTFPIQVRVKF